MSDLKFSILINNYNNAAFLRECLESAVNQSRPADEIIVVDDGSTDDSRVIIEEYAAKFSLIKKVYQKNAGQISAVSAGIASSSGDILFFLDGDDCYKVNHLETIEHYWKKHSHIDLIYCRSELLGDKNLIEAKYGDYEKKRLSLLGPVKNILEPYDWGYSVVLASFYPWYFMGNTTSALSIKRKHVIKLRLEELIGQTGMPLFSFDYTLLRASALYLGRKLYVPNPTVFYRVHENNYSLQKIGPSSEQCGKRYKAWLSTAAINHHLKPFLSAPHFFDIDLIEEEIKTIPNPSQGHLECYKTVANLTKNRTQELEAKIENIYGSLSWRVTKPLRKIKDLIASLLS